MNKGERGGSFTLADIEGAARVRSRAGSGSLLTLDESCAYTGLTKAALLGFIARGALREARPHLGLFARDGLDRVYLVANGIPDPVPIREAARIAGMSVDSFRHWIQGGKVPALKAGNRWYASRRAVAAEARRRARARERVRRQRELGELLTCSEVRSRLGICEAALFKAVRRGALKPIVIKELRRTYYRRASVDRLVTSKLIKGPRKTGLPPGYITVAEAARLLGVSPGSILSYAHKGILPVAARGAWGRRSAMGFRSEDVLLLKSKRDRLAQM